MIGFRTLLVIPDWLWFLLFLKLAHGIFLRNRFRSHRQYLTRARIWLPLPLPWRDRRWFLSSCQDQYCEFVLPCPLAAVKFFGFGVPCSTKSRVKLFKGHLKVIYIYTSWSPSSSVFMIVPIDFLGPLIKWWEPSLCTCVVQLPVAIAVIARTTHICRISVY